MFHLKPQAKKIRKTRKTRRTRRRRKRKTQLRRLQSIWELVKLSNSLILLGPKSSSSISLLASSILEEMTMNKMNCIKRNSNNCKQIKRIRKRDLNRINWTKIKLKSLMNNTKKHKKVSLLLKQVWGLLLRHHQTWLIPLRHHHHRGVAWLRHQYRVGWSNLECILRSRRAWEICTVTMTYSKDREVDPARLVGGTDIQEGKIKFRVNMMNQVDYFQELRTVHLSAEKMLVVEVCLEQVILTRTIPMAS